MISIIVPVYNGEKKLHKCINSIIAQTFKDWELILVNDGSKDNSGEICDSFSQKDSRIKVIHQKNGGVSKARNSGINVAKGEFIVFADADDWVEPNYLKALISESQYDLVITAYYYRPKRHIAFNYDLSFKGKEIRNFLVYKYLSNCSPWGKLYKRSIIEKGQIRFDESLKCYEDFVFILSYLLHCNSIRLLPTATYNYVNTPSIDFFDKYAFTHEEVKKCFHIVDSLAESLGKRFCCKKPTIEHNFLANCGYSHILDTLDDEDFYQLYKELYGNESRENFYNTSYISPVNFCAEQVLKEYKYKHFTKAIRHARNLVKIYGNKLDNVTFRKNKDRLYFYLIKHKMFGLTIIAATIMDCNKFDFRLIRR